MKTNLNEMIDVFKVQCECIYQRGKKTEIVHQDEVIIINNFETALCYFNKMLTKCNSVGYYGYHDYWIKLRKCDIMENGIPDCGEVILEHIKGDKEYDKRRIALKIKPDLGIWAIYDNKEERFLEETKPFYAFDTEWQGWKAIYDNMYFQNLNREREEI